MNEHGSQSDQPMHLHLSNCELFHNYISLFNLPTLDDSSTNQINLKEHLLNTVLNNYSNVNSNDLWSQLCFKESYYIKRFSSIINKGLKATKELQLFL